ncbi:outer membrane beta-barrel protein [Acidisoma sp. 7E03]
MRREACGIATAWLTALGCAAGVPARAQLIDSAYPRDVPGFDTARGVSVTSRIQQDVAWSQIPLGAGLLHPEVSESLSYDSAILAGQKPSWILATRPSVTYTSVDPARGGAVGATLSADSERYAQAPDQSYTDWTAALGAVTDIANCKVTAGYAHLALHQNDNALDAAAYDQPLAYSVDVLRLSAETRPSRLTLQPSADLLRFTFGSTTIGGLPAPQSYRDRLVGQLGLRLDYGLFGDGDPNQLEIVLRAGGAHYPNGTLTQPVRDWVGGTLLVGIEHDLDGLWGWRIALGVGGRAFALGYQDEVVPLGEAAITWQPSERTTWHGVVYRRIEDAANAGIGAYVATVAGIAVDHEVQRHLILHLGADLERADYAGGTHQTIATGRFGLLWLMSRSLRVDVSVSLSDHHASAGPNFGEDAVLIGVSAGL